MGPRDLLFFGALSLATRVGWLAAGVRFDFDTAGQYWQFLDLVDLRSRLGESLLHLHSQPPLLNALTGLALKLGGAGPVLLHGIFLALGILVPVGMFWLIYRFTGSRVAAWAVGLLCLLNPALVLFEKNYFTTYPVLALLVGALLALERYVTQDRHRWFVLYGAFLLGIVLTRSMYQPAWLLLNLTIPFLVFGKPRLRLVTSLVLVALAVAWPLKNQLLFGTFTTSSWSGMNLFNTVYNRSYSDEELRRFYAGQGLPWIAPPGAVSPIADRRPFNPPPAYEEHFTVEPTGVPVLDRLYKRNRLVNYNCSLYLDVSRTYLDDYRAVVQHDPFILARVFASSLGFYFRPATDYDVLALTPVSAENRNRVGSLDRVFRKAVYWQPAAPDPAAPRSPWAHFSYSVLLGTWVLLLGAPGAVWRLRRAGRTAESLCLLMIWLNVAYVFVVGNLFENYENMRFRLETEPLLVLGLAILVALGVRWRLPHLPLPPASRKHVHGS